MSHLAKAGATTKNKCHILILGNFQGVRSFKHRCPYILYLAPYLTECKNICMSDIHILRKTSFFILLNSIFLTKCSVLESLI